MGITIETIEPDATLPASSDVVIIGGGIIGIMTGLFLARDGISVTVCEKGEVGHEQSGRNWGWVRIMGRDASEIPLGLESMRLWSEMDRLVGGDTGFTRSGIVYVADTPAKLAEHEAWLDHARQYQLDSRLLSTREIDSLLPGNKRAFAGALFTPSDARAEPQKAVPAMARALRRHGGTVLTRCAVRGIETSAGRVSAVVTERGSIACQRVILAGGAWSRLFLGNLGIDFPQLKVLGSVLRTQPLEGPPTHAVGGSDFAFRKRQDGGYTIAHRGASVAEIVPDSFRLLGDFLPSFVKQRHELKLNIGGRFLEEARTARKWALDETTPFETTRILDPTPSEGILREGQANLIAAFPAFKDMKVAQAWGGFVDATPDAVPVIGEVPRLPGFFIASGFSGHGFGIGPGAGRLVADIVSGKAPLIDPTPFRLERFSRLERTTRAG